MGQDSGIQWTRHTFNPWIGCTEVSRECDNCYARQGSKRLAAQHRLTLWGEDSSRYFTVDDYWKQPAKWNRQAEAAGIRARVFCASYADVFEDRSDLVERRKRLMGIVEATPRLDWLLLTKRPENMSRLGWGTALWPGNVWAGTTVGVMASMPRLAELRKVPAAVRFVSSEPLLEDLQALPTDLRGIDWCIIGGESGPKARPFAIEWGERLARSARAAGAAVFWKQLGAYVVSEDRTMDGVWAWRANLKDGHGGDMSEWPAHLRHRDFPAVVHPAVSGRLRVPRSDPHAPTCECGSRGTLHVSGCTSADATRPQ